MIESESSVSKNHLEEAQPSTSRTTGPRCPIAFPTASEPGSEIPPQGDYRLLGHLSGERFLVAFPTASAQRVFDGFGLSMQVDPSNRLRYFAPERLSHLGVIPGRFNLLFWSELRCAHLRLPGAVSRRRDPPLDK